PTLPCFFTSALARDIREEHGAASIVTANNVFAHADDMADLAEGVRHLLDTHGIFVFEVSHLLDLVDNMVFDWVFHEHLCYHAVKPLRAFLAGHGMDLFDVERVGTKGGSIRGFAQLAGGPRAVTPSVEELIAAEGEAGLDRLETFLSFQARID